MIIRVGPVVTMNNIRWVYVNNLAIQRKHKIKECTQKFRLNLKLIN